MPFLRESGQTLGQSGQAFPAFPVRGLRFGGRIRSPAGEFQPSARLLRPGVGIRLGPLGQNA